MRRIMWTAYIVLTPLETLAPGEVRYQHPLFGAYAVVDTQAGRTGPIFHTVAGFREWEYAGKPRLPERPVEPC
jgi:hypothetical protein